MPPPTPLSIATSSVQRLIKEEASYHKELERQQARLQQTGASQDENADFQLRQEKAAIEETKAVFPPLRQRIANAVQTLEEQLEKAAEEGSAASDEEIKKAREVLESAKAAGAANGQ